MAESPGTEQRRGRRVPPSVWILGSVVLALGLVYLFLGPASTVERSASVFSSWREYLLIASTGVGSVTFLVALPVYLFSGNAKRAQDAGDLVKGLLSFFVGALTAGLGG